MIRVILDFDPTTSGLQVSAQDTQQPQAVLPPAIVFAVVNAAFITLLGAKIKAEIAGDQRVLPVDGAALRNLPRPNLG